MADLFNQQISATYSGLLKTSSSGVLSASLSQISDGRGNTSPLYLSTGSIQFYGAYSFPNADGSANQVLKTDGAGVLTWENDSLSNTLDFSGGTGTGSVTLDSQVLAFTGTANEIVTSASSQAITLSFPTAGVTLPDGSIATTQTASDNSTKVATTAYVEAAVAAGGDVTKTGTITANQIAVWNDSTDELRSDETVTIGTDHSITLYQPNTNSITTNYIIGGGSSMTTGQQNTGFGSSVLTLNTTGVGNVAIGSDSLTTNVSGNNNVAIGLETLKRTTASDNIAIGSRVLQFDTTGYKNTAIGGLSQSNITTAYENTSLGYNSLIFNSTGIQNTAIGLNSLKGVSTYSASNNTAIGYNSGSAITTGSNNVIIGSNTGSTITTSFNNIIISDGSGNIRQSFDSNGDATFSGSVAISEIATITQTDAGTEDRGLRLTNTTGSRNWNITAGRFNQNNDDFTIRCADTNIDALYLSVTGAATFSSIVNVGGTVSSPAGVGTFMGVVGRSGVGGGTAGIVLKDSEDFAWDIWNSGGGLNFRYNNGTSALAFSSTGGATFNSSEDNTVTINTSDAVNNYITLQKSGTDFGYLGTGSGILGVSQGFVTGDFILRSQGAIKLCNGNNAALTISSGGTVSIGSATATNPLSIRTANGESYLRFLNSDGSNYGDLERSVTGNGAVRITTPYFRVTGTLETQGIQSALGIVFNNNTGDKTSVTLNAYEEGTFTPFFNNDGTGSDLGSNYTRMGKYTRIGNMVYYIIDMSANISNTTGSFCSIGGLPYTSKTGTSYPVATFRDCTALTIPSGNILSFWVNENTSYIYIQSTSLTNNGSGTVNNWDSTGRVNITGMYRV